MAQKRTAREAFGRPKGQLSAVAAAKLARQKPQDPQEAEQPIKPPASEASPNDLAAVVGEEEYDGHHDRSSLTSSPEQDEVPSASTSRRQAVQLSWFDEWKATPNIDEYDMEISLDPNEIVTCAGEYGLRVRQGIATIGGSVLRAGSGPMRVYAPSIQALPQIQARQDSTMVSLSSVKPSLRKLERLSPLFRNIGSADDERSFRLLRSSEDDPLQRSLSALEIGKEIDATLRTLSAKVMVEPRKPRIMAIGAKSSGKSTFNRILCNHIQSWTSAAKCQYLDLDPGQPEFGPPGQASLVTVSAPLLGPSYTHVASPASNDVKLIRSHTIAAISFKHDPDHYRACALDLIGRADRDLPLIVNSCGWVNGLGGSVLTELVTLLKITDLALLEPLDAELIEQLQQTTNEVAIYRLPRQPPKPSPRTPAEHRAMQTMAYFHQRPTNTVIPKFSGRPISQHRPFTVSYASRDQSILAVASYGQSPKPAFLSEVLEGSVVAISVLDFGHAAAFEGAIAQTPEEIPYLLPHADGVNRTLDPKHSSCVGLALVRSIDTEAKQIHLVTPLSEDETAILAERDVVLVRGGFDAPEWAYLEDLYCEGESDVDVEERPWVSRREMVGIEGAVWRLRHPPLAASVVSGR